LTITANSPTTNKVVVIDDGRGDLTVTLNGATQSFSGVSDVTITVLGKTDQVSWEQEGTLKERILNVQVNLKGTSSNLFDFRGANVAALSTEQVFATGTGKGNDTISMDTLGLGTGATAALQASGSNGKNLIDLTQQGGVGAGAQLNLTAFTGGLNLPGSDIDLEVDSDVGQGAEVSVIAQAGSGSVRIQEDFQGQNDGTVTMQNFGGRGNTTSFSNVADLPGSTGTLKDFQGFGVGRGTDKWELEVSVASSPSDLFKVGGNLGAQNTATVTPDVQVSNCQVVNVI
jgi:hypothetical protein